MDVDGSCHCGKITFRAVVDLEKATLCHCTDCQTLSGSPYRAAVAASPASFRFLTGQPKTYLKTSESGSKRVQTFCGDCGSPIYSCAPGADPGAYNLRVGSLRQRAQIVPRRQIWSRSAMPWSASLAGVERIEKQ